MHRAHSMEPALGRFLCLPNPKSHLSGHPLLSSIITIEEIIEEHLIAAQPCMFRRRFVLSIIASLILCCVYISSVFSTPLHTGPLLPSGFSVLLLIGPLQICLLLFYYFYSLICLLKLSFHYLEQHRIIFPFMIFCFVCFLYFGKQEKWVISAGRV